MNGDPEKEDPGSAGATPTTAPPPPYSGHYAQDPEKDPGSSGASTTTAPPPAYPGHDALDPEMTPTQCFWEKVLCILLLLFICGVYLVPAVVMFNKSSHKHEEALRLVAEHPESSDELRKLNIVGAVWRITSILIFCTFVQFLTAVCLKFIPSKERKPSQKFVDALLPLAIFLTFILIPIVLWLIVAAVTDTKNAEFADLSRLCDLKFYLPLAFGIICFSGSIPAWLIWLAERDPDNRKAGYRLAEKVSLLVVFALAIGGLANGLTLTGLYGFSLSLVFAQMYVIVSSFFVYVGFENLVESLPDDGNANPPSEESVA